MSYERITKHTSPNQTAGSKGFGPNRVRRHITGITIHHWGDPAKSPTFAGVISWLCNPKSGVSAHAVIESGKVAYLVDYDAFAWHAGSITGNARTIGLELNPRASAGDYNTAAEHIADIWLAFGKLPLYPHKYWKATACPGRWNISKLSNLAEKFYNEKVTEKRNADKPKSKVISHKVRPGETLSVLSGKYATTVQAIVKQNNIKNPDLIRVGQILKITIR